MPFSGFGSVWQEALAGRLVEKMADTMIRQVMDRIDALHIQRRFCLVAIEGRCGSGKTRLASALHESMGWPVVHMDDFYLLPEERTESRMLEAGGNVAYERFARDVLKPLDKRMTACFRPYDCIAGKKRPLVSVGAAPVVIVEGSYSLHPELRSYYDLKVFLDVEKDEQLRRLSKRDTEELMTEYRSNWIPREETYIETFAVRQAADMYFMT